MKTIYLYRDSYSDTETLGDLTVGPKAYRTIERPWIPTDPGGKPRESCIPCGIYELRDHVRPNGDKVKALINHGLGVYYESHERTNNVGRFLILMHKGNWVKDIIGCIAPGKGKSQSDRGPMVTSSAKAMQEIMEYLDGHDCEIDIQGGSNYE